MSARHLLSIPDLDRDQIEELLDLTDTFVEVGRRAIPKVPALRGRTVVSLFFEDSTRTRLSFETAAKRLSADTMSFAVSSSSVNKGESVRDTIETIEAMGIDAVVVRHRSSGVPAQIARWTNAAVINAGDGWHQHPTQALLDAYTARTHLGSLEGRHVAIVGDIKHSRVARSNIEIFTALGARVTLVAPRTLLPTATSAWPVQVTHDLDSLLGDIDVCYLLRMQQERMTEALVPSLREYTSTFGLTAERASRLNPKALIMHPGPMNRGVEIAGDVADRPNAVITEQVSNGVAVRMAVLFMLLGSGRHLSPEAGNETGNETVNEAGSDDSVDTGTGDGALAANEGPEALGSNSKTPSKSDPADTEISKEQS
ncbi:MAG: aspartate carbamoyltransferase catalytic subunit [Microthrixaceae bacterium]